MQHSLHCLDAETAEAILITGNNSEGEKELTHHTSHILIILTSLTLTYTSCPTAEQI